MRAQKAKQDAAGAPTVAELLAVKKLAAERGGVEDFLGFVEQVESAANEVGGLDRLRECLSALQKLAD
jgi:hypothetical protein